MRWNPVMAFRARGPGEEGVTLLELGFSMLLMSFLMIAVVTTISTFMSTTNNAIKLGQADDQASLVIDQLQSQIVSANVLYNPATEGTNAGTNPDSTAIPAGFSLRIYTQVRGVPACVQWRVFDTGVVQSRTWTDTTPPAVSPWKQQMVGIVNPSTTPPFALDSTSAYGNRVLDLDLIVQTGTSKATTVTIASSLTARNAQFFQPAANDTADCTPVPSP